VNEAKDAENVMLRAELAAQRERYRRPELRVAELERRLGPDSTNSGIPPSKDRSGRGTAAGLLAYPCRGKVNAARGPGQSYPGSVSYGPRT
jgi:hypothetical protein